MRQKDQADFDLETFVDLFDTALTSDNPTVRRAFKNLILVASIVQAEENHDSIANGPLRRLVEDIRSLNRRIGQLEAQGAYRSSPNHGGYTYTGVGTAPSTQPTWVGTGVGKTGQWPNNGAGGPAYPLGGGGGGPTAWASSAINSATQDINLNKPVSLEAVERYKAAEDLLGKLENK